MTTSAASSRQHSVRASGSRSGRRILGLLANASHADDGRFSGSVCMQRGVVELYADVELPGQCLSVGGREQEIFLEALQCV